MDDVEALSTIVGIFRKLDEEAQKRVLASVQTFLGLSSLPPALSGGLSAQIEQPYLVSAERTAPFSEDRTISPKEFIRDKQPATDVERVACLAYYLTHYRNLPHFKTVDISTLNVEAAQPKFSSASVALENARAKGLLVPSTKGNKQLSANGEKYVELLPDREAAKGALGTVRVRKQVRRVKTKQRK